MTITKAKRPKLITQLHYGWVVVGLAFLSIALAVGSSQYAFGAFVGPLEQHFNWNRTQINSSLSFSAIGALLSPLVGRLMDRYGVRPVMFVSLLLLSVGYLLRPLMTELWHWYALSMVQYMGFPGAAMLPGGKLVGVWFENSRGRMMGVTFMGANFGGFVLTPVAGILISLFGWQWTYVTFALMALLIAPLVLLYVRDREEDVQRALSSSAATSPATPRQATRLSSQGLTIPQALRTRSFYAVCLAIMFTSFTYPAVLPNIIPHLIDVGLSLSVASLALTVFAIFGMSGKVLFGFLTELFQARYALMLSLAIQIASLWLLITLGGTSFLWAFIPVFGIAFGGVGALMTLIVQDTFGLKNFGSIFGLVSATTVVSAIVGPLMTGAIRDATGHYTLGFVSVMGFFTLAIAFLLLAKPVGNFRVTRAPAHHASVSR